MKKFIPFFLAAIFTAAFNIVNAQRITVTIGGTGFSGYSGDNGPAKLAKIGTPQFTCSDAAGNVYFVDASKLRKIAVRNGLVSTVVTGLPITNICCDPMGKVYLVAMNRIDVFDPSTGLVSNYAGTVAAGYGGDGGPATSATFSTSVTGVASDALGNIYVVDNGNHRIREISAVTGIVTTIAGTGTAGYTGDGGPATLATINNSQYIACNSLGDIFFTDQSSTGSFDGYIRKITAATGYMSKYAGGGGSIEDCPATSTELGPVSGLCVNASDNVRFDETSCSCREIGHINDTTQYIGGNFGAESYKDDTNSLYAWMNTDYGITSDANDNIYIADDGNNRIRKLIKLTHTPTFAYGRGQTINACPGYGYTVDSLLAITDLDNAQNETWTVVIPPVIGSLTGLPASALSDSTYKTTKPLGYLISPRLRMLVPIRLQ